ncbi:8143_t:CDS:1 [Dentiscutata erythropus]|uniref:8143_t:CDS:1 n=1 Tax=Dentiscutata erythropus TaxID=1348616 RepID=A0A9N9K1N5_9GLOM|nr:8143_t:CDS:1 [Dentiscutata erythropus]
MTQQQIIDFANNYQLDILGLTETQHSPHNQFHILKNNLNQNPNDKEFTYYWTKGSETHNHGVGIMVEKQLNKHVTSIQTFENHAITLDMVFKRKIKVKIITIYFLPANRPANLVLRTRLMEWIKTITKKFNSTDTNRIIILGDFNSVKDPTIDRSATSKYRSNKMEGPLLKYLTNKNYIDTFCTIQNIKLETDTEDATNTLQFTWTRNESKSRIDQIWLSPKTADILIDADIIDTEEEIATDHHCARAILLDTFRKPLPSNIYKQKTQYRYNLNTTQKENWDKFAKEFLIKQSQQQILHILNGNKSNPI